MEKRLTHFGWYIKRIDNAIARNADRDLAGHGLTAQQSRLLFILGRADGEMLTMKELEGMFNSAQSTVAGLVQRLEKKGLVEGLMDPRDRRVKHVRLTEAGKAISSACYQDIVNTEERLAALLTESEKEQFLLCLQKVYQAICGEENETRNQSGKDDSSC